MDKKNIYATKTTFDLAFGLATDQYNEEDKLIILNIIRERDGKDYQPSSTAAQESDKTYKKGSKSEKIFNLHKQNKTPKQIYDLLNAKRKPGEKPNVYYPEIYRITGKKK